MKLYAHDCYHHDFALILHTSYGIDMIFYIILYRYDILYCIFWNIDFEKKEVFYALYDLLQLDIDINIIIEINIINNYAKKKFSFRYYLEKKLIVSHKFNEWHDIITIATIINVLMFGIELLLQAHMYYSCACILG